eukprot:scaffold17490_cov72-Skeletonema_dohrnii-CCMP3373.AAC.2
MISRRVGGSRGELQQAKIESAIVTLGAPSTTSSYVQLAHKRACSVLSLFREQASPLRAVC